MVTVTIPLFEKVSLPRVPRKKGGREERCREGEKRFYGIMEGARQKQKHVSVCVSVCPSSVVENISNLLMSFYANVLLLLSIEYLLETFFKVFQIIQYTYNLVLNIDNFLEFR